MGNQLRKEYDFTEEQSGSGGIGLRWRLYDATEKSTGRECTVWLLDKAKISKRMRTEAFFDLFRKEAREGNTLRHPGVLSIIKPLQESRNELCLVTERVLGSIANLLGDDTNLPKVPMSIVSHKFSELDIKTGLGGLGETIMFLHRDAKMYHLFVDPATVYVTPKGQWKLFGFYFLKRVNRSGEIVKLDWDFTNKSNLAMLPGFPCLSPEIALKGEATEKSDAWSLGRLAYYVQRHKSGVRPDSPILEIHEFRGLVNGMRRSGANTHGLPDSLKKPLQNLLQVEGSARTGIRTFCDSDYFSDVVVKCLRYLEKLLEKEVASRIQFLKKLPQVLDMFDQKTLIQKVLGPLVLQMQDKNMTMYTLPPIMQIADRVEKQVLQQQIWPSLKAYLVMDDPPQLLFLHLKHIKTLLVKLSQNDIRDHVIPLLCRGLEKPNVSIQGEALRQLTEAAEENLLEFRDLRNKALPKICHIATLTIKGNPKILTLRVTALKTLSKIFKHFDHDVIKDTVMAAVEKAIQIEPDQPALIMSALGVYDAIGKHVPVPFIASNLLPKIIPLTTSNTLNKTQFQLFMKVIRGHLERVEKFQMESINRKTLHRVEADKMVNNNPLELNLQKPDDNPLAHIGNAKPATNSGITNSSKTQNEDLAMFADMNQIVAKDLDPLSSSKKKPGEPDSDGWGFLKESPPPPTEVKKRSPPPVRAAPSKRVLTSPSKGDSDMKLQNPLVGFSKKPKQKSNDLFSGLTTSTQKPSKSSKPLNSMGNDLFSGLTQPGNQSKGFGQSRPVEKKLNLDSSGDPFNFLMQKPSNPSSRMAQSSSSGDPFGNLMKAQPASGSLNTGYGMNAQPASGSLNTGYGMNAQPQAYSGFQSAAPMSQNNFGTSGFGINPPPQQNQNANNLFSFNNPAPYQGFPPPASSNKVSSSGDPFSGMFTNSGSNQPVKKKNDDPFGFL